MRLDAFRGTWRVSRTIEDVRGAQTGTFAGVAVFAPAEIGLTYREEGAMTLGGRSFAASRAYSWREAGLGVIELRFPDGRFFHRFYADEARPTATHDCGDDRYRVAYDFARWPRWRAEWRVTGPRKDYAMVSEYRPAGQASVNGA